MTPARATGWHAADHDPAFVAWCEELSDELCIDDSPPDASEWLWEIFALNGSMPPYLVAPLVFQRRLELTERALRDILAAASADLGFTVQLKPNVMEAEPCEPTGQVRIYIDEIQAIGPIGVFSQVADAVQTYIGEYLHHLWPTCPDHHTGTHPMRTADGVAWSCSTGNHIASTMTAPR